jgi:hypothetical protein
VLKNGSGLRLAGRSAGRGRRSSHPAAGGDAGRYNHGALFRTLLDLEAAVEP